MNILSIIAKKKAWFVSAMIVAAASGCTIHPVGEKQERNLADREGQPFAKKAEDRQLPVLSREPTPDEFVRYALLASPELEQRYWEWRSAIEQIPQDGTQATNLVLSAGVPITRGSTAFNRTTVTVANDPMADIVWPSKLGTAAERALENAKAAGFRFQKAKYDLRQKVLDAYYDYLLASELLRLDQTDGEILDTSATITEAGIASGKSTQSEAIKSRNEADLLKYQIIEEQARLKSLVAALNAAIGRDPTMGLNPAIHLPVDQKVIYTDEQILQSAAERNPELAALAAEVRGREQGIRLAKLQYVPDFSLSVSSDLAGNVQNLLGTLTVPLLRYEAINAAIAQADANLRATTAIQQQADYDLRSRVISDIALQRSLETELGFLNELILPRVRQNVEIIRSSYESGHVSMSDLFEAQRSAVAVERLVVQIKVTLARRRIDLESVTAKTMTAEPFLGD